MILLVSQRFITQGSADIVVCLFEMLLPQLPGNTVPGARSPISGCQAYGEVSRDSHVHRSA